jgi:hypothetical protein
VEWAKRVQAAYDRVTGRDLRARMAAVAAEAEAARQAREAAHRARMAKWEAHRPAREAALAAYEAANARRRAELGLGAGQPIPVLAAFWTEPPRRPAVW